MENDKIEEKVNLENQDNLINRLETFDWSILFEDPKADGLIGKILPYVSVILIFVTMIVVIVKK